MNISWQQFHLTADDIHKLADLVTQLPNGTSFRVKRKYRDLSETIGSSTMYVDVCGLCGSGCYEETDTGGWRYISMDESPNFWNIVNR